MFNSLLFIVLPPFSSLLFTIILLNYDNIIYLFHFHSYYIVLFCPLPLPLPLPPPSSLLPLLSILFSESILFYFVLFSISVLFFKDRGHDSPPCIYLQLCCNSFYLTISLISSKKPHSIAPCGYWTREHP